MIPLCLNFFFTTLGGLRETRETRRVGEVIEKCEDHFLLCSCSFRFCCQVGFMFKLAFSELYLQILNNGFSFGFFVLQFRVTCLKESKSDSGHQNSMLFARLFNRQNNVVHIKRLAACNN